MAGKGRRRRPLYVKGIQLRVVLPAVGLTLALSGCASFGSASSPPTTTPTPRVLHLRTPTPQPRPTAPRVLAMSLPYRQFAAALCAAFAHRNADAVRNDLPYYQYNSGVRYGMLGDGEGQTGDPSLLTTWLTAGSVRCRYLSRDIAGHGTLLASGWTGAPGPWSLIEMDTYNGVWKINDFTFGSRNRLLTAMQTTSSPIEVYRG